MDQIVTRHRHELKRRTLTVSAVETLTPHMVRITFSGEELADFVSLAPDDHVKLRFPSGGEEPLMREYTPRAFDTDAGRLVIDFALHEAGPATAWALAASPGDTLVIGGPRGSAVVAPVFDWWLLIGDETALPAIGRRLEELAPGAQAVSLVAVPGAADEQLFDTAARHAAHWVHRPVAAAAEAAPLLDAARTLSLPDGRGYVWIAAEARVARALRDHFLNDRGHPKDCMKAAGYWTQGLADTSDKSLD
ncbi:siderophore-interacting protein [Pseudooceanicola sp. LIPI14-2-Ac024]|uniref:siderophore-interacting protein n=1 Tax=Pseudooceanicola sp. LIPI14-2-Ac024 TaxID=3344875 RepID=UPI0035CFD36D